MPSVAVLSPHPDDGVFSLGATLARWARSGVDIRLVTVCALDPESPAPAGGWDRRAGFATEGEAASGRRAEDAAAGALLGVTTLSLPFGSSDYDRHGSDDDVWAAIRGTVVSADVTLVPGWPLEHPDHAWLHELAAARAPGHSLARYAEQPYTLRRGGAPFECVRTETRDRVAKWRAIRSYRSQLPLLAMTRTLRRGPLRLAWADEHVEWPSGGVRLAD